MYMEENDKKENKFKKLMIKAGKGLSWSFDKIAKATSKFAEMNNNFAKNRKDDINEGISIKENLKEKEEILKEKEEQTKVWEGYNSDKSKDKKKNIENEKISLSSEKMATNTAIALNGLLWASSTLLKHISRLTSATLGLIKEGLDKGINKAEQKQSEHQKPESLETLNSITTDDKLSDNKKHDNKQKITSHNLSSISTNDDEASPILKQTEQKNVSKSR